MDNKDDISLVNAKDPKLFQEMLIDIVRNATDEITSDSAENASSMPYEMKRDIRKAVVESCREALEELFAREAIPDKIKRIQKLELEADLKPAWRPTTGQIPITTLTGHFTERKKIKLAKRLMQLREESLELQQEIIRRRKDIEKQMKQIQKSREDHLVELHKKCCALNPFSK